MKHPASRCRAVGRAGLLVVVTLVAYGCGRPVGRTDRDDAVVPVVVETATVEDLQELIVGRRASSSPRQAPS